MELDDIALAWRSLEQRLDQQAALTGQVLSDLRSHAARAYLRPLWLRQSAQLLCAIALSGIVAHSWLRFAEQAAAVVGGVLLQVWCIALAASAACQLWLLSQLDFTRQLLQTQRALAQLRRWRTRVAPWLGLAFWALWVAVADAAWRAITGLSLPNAWLLCNVLVGVLGGIGIWLGYRRLQRSGHPWLERLDAAHAGRSIARNETLLEPIARFQRE
ncbi:hypothetical protein [Xanthomonas oryzae]|uniref:hypothetical protein n=1 Tax=Xanthomonas oryzae TaxID=347 RepID=UPI00041B0719|nr:hypothetical protein [Xanthomonas oryzae]ALS95354.1 hypothetical protein AXO1947_13340 [Xanthomonas oryzae pv. oryzae]AUI90114.1 hypothetical protein BVV16_07855 [Xanthomonas oryzae pv. oryzae]AUI93794.1 hypothetical protein BVV17_07865 [Xanthomonas oryzae pv. oryzae]AUI97463.1 hypothetical protein BVV18_07870 [Xanthomonas oryzae pv. oryzae]AUJ01138.1 hypothetical protein BVV10_07875 [Xanthomonas oryzae pv. oryzae]